MFIQGTSVKGYLVGLHVANCKWQLKKDELFLDALWSKHPLGIVVLAVSWGLVRDHLPGDVLSLETGFQQVRQLGLDKEHFNSLLRFWVCCLKIGQKRVEKTDKPSSIHRS